MFAHTDDNQLVVYIVHGCNLETDRFYQSLNFLKLLSISRKAINCIHFCQRILPVSVAKFLEKPFNFSKAMNCILVREYYI